MYSFCENLPFPLQMLAGNVRVLRWSDCSKMMSKAALGISSTERSGRALGKLLFHFTSLPDREMLRNAQAVAVAVCGNDLDHRIFELMTDAARLPVHGDVALENERQLLIDPRIDAVAGWLLETLGLLG